MNGTWTLSANDNYNGDTGTILLTGDYTVAFHVVFRDGSETTGARSFSVGTGVAPRPAAVDAALGHQHDIDPLSAVLLTVDLAVVAGAGLLLLLRPRSS